MNNKFAIETQELSKRYEGNVLAVDGVDLAIPTNSIYALLGPNGAGKTTTMKILVVGGGMAVAYVFIHLIPGDPVDQLAGAVAYLPSRR